MCIHIYIYTYICAMIPLSHIFPYQTHLKPPKDRTVGGALADVSRRGTGREGQCLAT